MPCAAPFDDDEWLFSVDWDGVRALLFIDPDGAVRIQGEMLPISPVAFPTSRPRWRSRRGEPRCSTASSRCSTPRGVRISPDSVAGLPPDRSPPPSFPPCTSPSTSSISTAGPPSGWSLDRRLDALSELAGHSDVLQVPDHVRGRGTRARRRGLRTWSGRFARPARRRPVPPGAGLAGSSSHSAGQSDDLRRRRHRRAAAPRPSSHPRGACRRPAHVRRSGGRAVGSARRRAGSRNRPRVSSPVPRRSTACSPSVPPGSGPR